MRGRDTIVSPFACAVEGGGLFLTACLLNGVEISLDEGGNGEDGGEGERGDAGGDGVDEGGGEGGREEWAASGEAQGGFGVGAEGKGGGPGCDGDGLGLSVLALHKEEEEEEEEEEDVWKKFEWEVEKAVTMGETQSEFVAREEAALHQDEATAAAEEEDVDMMHARQETEVEAGFGAMEEDEERDEKRGQEGSEEGEGEGKANMKVNVVKDKSAGCVSVAEQTGLWVAAGEGVLLQVCVCVSVFGWM